MQAVGGEKVQVMERKNREETTAGFKTSTCRSGWGEWKECKEKKRFGGLKEENRFGGGRESDCLCRRGGESKTLRRR